jgi:hypothetical protein
MDFDGVRRLIETSDLSPSPSEVQGILCGLICGGDPRAVDTWLDQVLTPSGAQAADLLAAEARRGLTQLAAETLEEIQGPAMGLSLLLPHESDPAILPAAKEAVRNRDVHYPYRQDSDFAIPHRLLRARGPDGAGPRGRKEGELVLFCRPRDPERELWDGARAGIEGAVEPLRRGPGPPDRGGRRGPADAAGRIASARLYYPLAADPELDLRLMDWVHAVRGKARKRRARPRELITSISCSTSSAW